MYVIDVIPFSRSMVAGSLSYRSLTRLSEGAIVEVPLRKQHVRGIVVACIPAIEAKASIKTANYTLRSSSVAKVGALPKALMDALHATATYHAAPLAAVLGALLSEVLVPDAVPSFAKIPATTKSVPQDLREQESLIHVLEIPRALRIERYRALAKENHEKKLATLLVAPTTAEAEGLAKTLKAEKPTLITGTVRGKKRDQILEGLADATGLVIATPSFSYAPIARLGAIVIERASAGSYLLPKRPYLDMRFALRALALARAIPLWYGDFPIPLELRPRASEPLAKNVEVDSSLGSIEILDTREPEQKKTKSWQALPPEMRDAISGVFREGGRSLVLAIRRGYAPAVVCRDCGTPVRDERGIALSFALDGGKRVFRSADGRTVSSATVLCAHCGSWNLLPLGIGVERLEEEIRDFLPEAQLVMFDADTIRTPAQGRKALARAKEPGAILIGTEFMLSWISSEESLDLAVVASADSLLALPFWKARERFVRLGLMLRERANHTIIGTRKPDDVALSAITDPTDSSFFAEETSLRTILHYPPFGVLVVFQIEGTESRIEAAKAAIRTIVGNRPIIELPTRTIAGTRLRATIVLRLAPTEWPDDQLARDIANLPPSIKIFIDPESLW